MRTVLTLNPTGEDPKPHVLGIESAPLAVQPLYGTMDLDPNALPPLFGDAGAEEHGKKLYEELTKHTGVGQILNYLANTAGIGPIYFRTGSAYSELVCWEALNRAGNFFTLGRWPISRIAREVNSEPRTQPYPFDGTLRVMAVLSAYGVSAEEEWNGLKEAIASARADGLSVKLSVILGEEGLLAKATADCAARGDEVAPLVGSGYDLLRLIEQFRPQVLHFFCHGRTEVRDHTLEMARIRDRKEESGRGSVQLKAEHLKSSPVISKEVWLVTLNCCKMGGGTSEVRSMTHSMVAEGGIPAAVGMLEPINADDAHAFCRYFYPELFALLRSDLGDLQSESGTNPNAVKVIEWAATMSRARQGLQERHPSGGSRPCWTLPALYVRPEMFSVQLTQPGARSPRDQIIYETIAGLIQHVAIQRGDDVKEFHDRLTQRLADMAAQGRRSITPEPPPRRNPPVSLEMSANVEKPANVELNAWTGAPSSGGLASDWEKWVIRNPPRSERPLASRGADPRDWQDRRVGWGLVLPDKPTRTPRDLATAFDAPGPIQDLLASRPGSPVLRYSPDPGNRFLRRYDPIDGSCKKLDVVGTEPGIGEDRIPAYLLIVGPPTSIPWEFQYTLNLSRCVGRLDLPEDGLKNYVNALKTDWADAKCRRDQPVVWATDLGGTDITNLMRLAIADPLAHALGDDPEVKATGRVTYLKQAAATWDGLIGALNCRCPALVVTTSHGQTAPLGHPAEMARDLGIPVDAGGQTLPPEELARKWAPDGAIWYAHACCSAGSDATNHYKGLFVAGTDNDRLLQELADLKGLVSPLPARLLGHEKPLRAFIGHVHPTTDWVIRQPETRQAISGAIVKSIYENLYDEKPMPVSMALGPCYAQIGAWYDELQAALDNVDRGIPLASLVGLRAKFCAFDRRSMVILGDPTACLPSPPARTP